MKKSAITAVALAALLVSPVFSAGYVGAKYKYHSVEVEDFSFVAPHVYSGDQSDWQLDGSFGFVQDSFGGQIEGRVGSYGDNDVWTVAGHAFWPGDGWRLGGLISIVNVDRGTYFWGMHSESQEISFGLEGSFDFTSELVGRLHATVGEAEHSLSGGMFSSPSSSTNDTWYAEAGASYYLSPRARLDAAIGFGSTSVHDESDALTFSVGGEVQPLDLPLSITARYSRSSDDYPAVAMHHETDTFSVGLRLSFGAETIRDRDRTTPYNGQYGASQHLYDF